MKTLLACFVILALSGCAALNPKASQDGTSDIPVQGCYVWPEEGADAYTEVTKACGGEGFPKCPKEKAWRSALRNLKSQLTACGSDQL